MRNMGLATLNPSHVKFNFRLIKTFVDFQVWELIEMIPISLNYFGKIYLKKICVTFNLVVRDVPFHEGKMLQLPM